MEKLPLHFDGKHIEKNENQVVLKMKKPKKNWK